MSKTGMGGGEGGGHSPLKHSQSHNSFISPTKQPTTSTSSSGLATAAAAVPMKKFPLATHRYGKEELLQLFSDDAERPDDIPNVSPLTRNQLLTPLSFMPLSEEEQVSFKHTNICVTSESCVVCTAFIIVDLHRPKMIMISTEFYSIELTLLSPLPPSLTHSLPTSFPLSLPPSLTPSFPTYLLPSLPPSHSLSLSLQVALSGGMNSDTVYSNRGRGGGFFRGRGRGVE